MVTIYQDYDDEPEDVFLPIPELLAARFYALEMDSYNEDINFYQQLLPKDGPVLELGCGTGRITKQLATNSDSAGQPRQLVGLDISLAMLQLSKHDLPSENATVHFLCMDMIYMAFSTKFTTILIPYNTLNLLGSEEDIVQCLHGCKQLLHPGGKILLQLFIPTPDFIQQKKSFQFQMFDRPEGGKIIKEILKEYQPNSQTIEVEERYRVRPMLAGNANEDWHSKYTIAGYSADKWFSLIDRAGLNPTDTYSDFNNSPGYSPNSSILLVSLTL